MLFCCSLSRMRPHNMTATSWKRRAPCSPWFHLRPPPHSSAAPSPSPRVSQGRICLKTPKFSLVSPSPYPSPRVHRVACGCRRHHNPRRKSLEWDFDVLVCFFSVAQRESKIFGVPVTFAKDGKRHTTYLNWIHDSLNHWDSI